MIKIYKSCAILTIMISFFYWGTPVEANDDNTSCSGSQGYVNGTSCSQGGSVWWVCASSRCFPGSTECVYRSDFRSCGHWVACPVCPNNPPCVPGSWGAWSACSKACGGGTQSRSNGCSSQSQPCNTQPCLNISANPSTLPFSGGSSQISWSTTNATRCSPSGNGWLGGFIPSPAGGNLNQLLPPNNNPFDDIRMFSLECFNNANLSSGVQSAMVKITPPPAPSLNIFATTPVLPYTGGSSQITWSTMNAVRCAAGGDGWSIPVPTSINGSINQSFLPNNSASNVTKTFLMECWNVANVSSGIKSVTVTVQAPPTPALNLSINPVMVNNKGDSSRITWTSTDAVKCSAGLGWSGDKGVNGTENQAIDAFKTFTLYCENVAGVRTAVKSVSACYKTDCAKDTCIGTKCQECSATGPIMVDGIKDCRDENWIEIPPN